MIATRRYALQGKRKRQSRLAGAEVSGVERCRREWKSLREKSRPESAEETVAEQESHHEHRVD